MSPTTRNPLVRAFRGPALAAALALGAPPAGAQPDTWKDGARMPSARSESRAAVIGGLIHFPAGFGGPDHHAAYDPAADTWKGLKPLPAPGYDHPMVEAHGGKLYVIKGKTLEYDPAADAWAERRRSTHVRDDGTAVAFGEYIYIFGGTGQPRPVERYHPGNDTWEERAVMATLRGHVQAVAFGGRIWVIGGRAGSTPHGTVEIYDPAADTWAAGPALNEPHSGHMAAVVDGRIVVAGGEVIRDGAPALVSAVEIYDPAVGRWERAKDMPVPVHGAGSVAFGGRMYVIGGSLKAYAAVNSDRVLIYEPPAAGSPVLSPARRARTDGPRGALRVPGLARLAWAAPPVEGATPDPAEARRVDALGVASGPDR